MTHPRVSKAVNPQHRRKLSLKQIAAGFGGKRRQSAVKSKRRTSAKKHRHAAPKAAKANPKRRAARSNATPRKQKRRATAKRRNATPKVVYRYKTRTKTVYRNAKPKRKATAARRKSRNPGPHYLLTMSPAGNPTVRRKRRKTTMAKAKRRVSAKSRSGKRRSNPTRRRTLAKRNAHRRRASNPFGAPSSGTIKTGFGVFLGFSAAKKIPPMLGPGANSSPVMSLVSTAAVAAIATFIARKFAPGSLADGVMWGGVGGVINVAWNAWAPSPFSGYLGVGDLVPGSFPLPQGPVGLLAPGGMSPSVVNQAPVNMGAWGSAW